MRTLVARPTDTKPTPSPRLFGGCGQRGWRLTSSGAVSSRPSATMAPRHGPEAKDRQRRSNDQARTGKNPAAGSFVPDPKRSVAAAPFLDVRSFSSSAWIGRGGLP